MSAPSRGTDDSSRSDDTPRRTRRRPGENRERLVEAGIAVFGSHGYHGASTASIAALAGVPQPHVYANFQTKQELFLECARRVSAHLGQCFHGGGLRGAAYPTIHPAFLLQCFAAYQEELLQPELREVLVELTDALGIDAVMALVAESAHATLSCSASGTHLATDMSVWSGSEPPPSQRYDRNLAYDPPTD